MSIKTKLMTSAAALTLITGAAMAEKHSAAEMDTQGEYAAGWNENLDRQYGDLADTQIAELIGMNVISENGDDVGEVDNFVLMEDELRAVVGVGGFLGLGEHEVAISLSDMTYNGENLVIAFTKEELEAMPEYTEELEARQLAETDTFRSRQMTEDGDVMETAGLEGSTGTMENNAEVSGAAQPQGEQVAAEGEATIETDEDAGQETADASEDGSVSPDELQTEQASNMETVEEGGENKPEDMASSDGETEVEAEGEMTVDVDPGTDEDASPTGEEVAAADDAAEANGMDGDTTTEEVAEAEQGAIEQEVEELTAEAGNAAEDAGNAIEGAAEDIASADPGTPEDASPTGEEVAAAEDAAEANGMDGDTVTEEVAENEQGEIEQEAEELMAEAGNAAEEAGNAVEGAAATTAAAAGAAADEVGDWMANFAEIAEWQINEIEGKDVASTDGNVIGEVDDLARQDGRLVALVGIGGFLGLGEHDVALDMSNLTWDGEKFVAEGYTEDDLKAMSEYDADSVEMLDDDITLRDVNM